MAAGPGRPKKTVEANAQSERRTTPPNLTPEEAAIFQRVKSEKDDWQTITEGDMHDFSLAADPFELPEPAKKMQTEKKLAFRWAEKKPSRIDELRNAEVPLKWWLCNAIQTPFLKDFVDPVHGGVQRLDQLLMFKPWWMQEKVRNAKRELADMQYRGGEIKRKHGQKVDDSGSEWLAGEQFKITGKDEIMDPGNMMTQEYIKEDAAMPMDSSDLGDLVTDE